MPAFRRALALVASTVLIATLAPVGAGGVLAQDAPTPPDPTVTDPTTPPVTDPTTTTTAAPTTTGPPPTAPDGTPAPISEQVGPPEAPLPDPSRHLHVLLAALGLHDAQQGVDDAQAGLDAALVARDDADARTEDARRALADAQASLDSLRSLLASYGAWAYMYAGDSEVMAGLQGDLTATQRQKQFLSVSIEHQDELVKEEKHRVDDAEHALADRESEASDAARGVDAASTALDDAHTALDDAHKEQATAVADEQRGVGDWQLTLEGPSAFNADELARYFIEQGQQSHATVSIEELAGYFIDEGTAEGIRGDMAFAQAILETGSFGNPDTIDRNNYAGIGHCGDCDGGFIFDSAQLGVRGQMQLLKSYAVANPEHANPLVDKRLVGPTGCCQNWNQLAGVWAGDPNYGPRIQSIYQSMLEWLLQQRTGSAPPPAPEPRPTS